MSVGIPWGFYIQNHVVCDYRQLSFLLSHLDALYLIFLPNCPSCNFQYTTE